MSAYEQADRSTAKVSGIKRTIALVALGATLLGGAVFGLGVTVGSASASGVASSGGPWVSSSGGPWVSDVSVTPSTSSGGPWVS